MLRLLPQPKPQSAEATILTLCDRLQHSLLVEDRRAAVLGLKGFSHEYRELVVASGLRGLLDVLVRDSVDEETERACLETLLILFGGSPARRRVPNRRYISPLRKTELTEASEGDDIALWLADEMSHNPEVVKTLFGVISESADPFLVAYALQLVSAVAVHRPAAARLAVLEAPLGVTTLVQTLDSPQDMVRSEGVLLLGSLAPDHRDLQKMLAFQGVFDKIFAMIREEGGIIYGSTAVSDCLTLLWTLLAYNVSNQKLFGESGGLGEYVQLIEDASDTSWVSLPPNLVERATSNVVLVLQIAEVFVIAGSENTHRHQDAFARAGALMAILRLAFGPETPAQVRTGALIAAAPLVAGNSGRQTEILALDVPYYDLTIPRTVALQPVLLSVSQALLGWSLTLSSSHLFELRAAARLALSAAFEGNSSVASGFINEQISQYTDGDDEAPANIVAVLADYSDSNKLDPYRVWFASSIIMRLLGLAEPRKILTKFTLGAEDGMESHTLIQAVAGQLQTALTLGSDPAGQLAYIQLLVLWLHDDTSAVSEFVAESSVLQSLISIVSVSGGHHPLIESCATVLLGTAYLFCPPDAPYSRVQLHTLLTKTLGRDQYALQLRRLRSSPEFAEYDLEDPLESAKRVQGAPQGLLLAPFVNLVRENLSRLRHALDRDPSAEPISKVSLEQVDDLAEKLRDRTERVKSLEVELEKIGTETAQSQTEMQLAQKRLQEVQKDLEMAQAEQEQVSSRVNDLEADLESKSKALDETHNVLTTLQTEHSALKKTYEQLQSQATTLGQAKDKAEGGINKMTRELIQLQRAHEQAAKKAGDLEKAMEKSKSHTANLEKLEKKSAEMVNELRGALKSAESEISRLQAESNDWQSRHGRQVRELELAKARVSKLDSTLGAELESLKQKLEEQNNSNKESETSWKQRVSDIEKSWESRLEKMNAEWEKKQANLQAQHQGALVDLESSWQRKLADLESSHQKAIDKALQEAQASRESVNSRANDKELEEKQAALDELLILLDGLSEQKSVYKARLRAVGESVSDSDSGSDSGSDSDSDSESKTEQITPDKDPKVLAHEATGESESHENSSQDIEKMTSGNATQVTEIKDDSQKETDEPTKAQEEQEQKQKQEPQPEPQQEASSRETTPKPGSGAAKKKKNNKKK